MTPRPHPLLLPCPPSCLIPTLLPITVVHEKEVVDFPDSYLAMLGWRCFAKFVAIPNYSYLKLKISDPMEWSPSALASNRPTIVTRTALPLRQ